MCRHLSEGKRIWTLRLILQQRDRWSQGGGPLPINRRSVIVTNSRTCELKRFQAKHVPGLDPGMDTDLREENASNQKNRAHLRFNQKRTRSSVTVSLTVSHESCPIGANGDQLLRGRH
jgi:hypothetical protein